eukprot:TRINITY_DN14186_c0_g1_i1.p1 TRINITY_DN14186_c0_g1~~TRINITY_DN14186_c0_g1_i1.p1  ORF type:complete len:420 (-),score=109.13 TRINITY_DN14186_c0_g1_i1:11-1207(-)
MGNDKQKPRRKLILTIDGGGVKGIIPALTLQALKEKVDEKVHNQPWDFRDAFDVIGGTSTGSIIAAGLCKNDPLPPATLVQIYKDNAKKIFPYNNSISAYFFNTMKVPLYTNAYNPKPLEDLLKEYLKDQRLSDVGGKAQLLACAYDLEQRQPRFFFSFWHATEAGQKKSFELERNHRAMCKAHGETTIAKEFRAVNWHLWEVCRASSAAPLFLPPYEFRGFVKDTQDGQDKLQTYSFVDGGLFANNPLLHTMAAIFDIEGKVPDSGEVALVCLGTGFSDVGKPFVRSGILTYLPHWTREALEVSMDGHSHAVHDAFKFALCPNSPIEYMRFTPKLSKSVDFNDSSDKTMQALESETKRWLAQSRTQKKLKMVANWIIEELDRTGKFPKQVEYFPSEK